MQHYHTARPVTGLSEFYVLDSTHMCAGRLIAYVSSQAGKRYQRCPCKSFKLDSAGGWSSARLVMPFCLLTRYQPSGLQRLVLCGGSQILQRQTPCSHSLPVSACFSLFAACSTASKVSTMTSAPHMDL